MAYIQPNSDIVLFRNIKLDSAYENTIYFSSRGAQESYFFSNDKVLQHLTAYSYRRTMDNTIKVKLPVGTVAQSTYMAFKNTSYENKWFYCFIADYNYVNDNTTEIVYAIDIMQTFFIGDCTLNQCYVEREHAVDDTVGANRVPEPIGSDNVHYVEKWHCPQMEEYSAVVSASAQTPFYDPTDDFFKQGLFCGLDVKTYSMTSHQDAETLMGVLSDMLGDGNYETTGQRQQLVSVYMFPSAFCAEGGQDFTKPYSVTQGFQINRTDVDGYVPKNNKLLTAPYKSLLLTNGIGGAVSMEYDDFTIGTVSFKVWGVCTGSGEMVCVPQWYRGVENNYDYKLMINGFPQCGYTLDAYRAWIAGGGDKYQKLGIINGIAEGLKTGFKIGHSYVRGNYGETYEQLQKSMTAGAPISKAVNASDAYEASVRNTALRNAEMASSIGGTIYKTGVNYLTTEYDVMATPNTPAGEQSASCMVAMKELNFRCYEINIIADDAKRIDDFFSMFGYATKRTKVPNISSRPQWNYVKTQGCSISGNIPSVIRSAICELFDNGIRFWNNGDNIGNYSLANK